MALEHSMDVLPAFLEDEVFDNSSSSSSSTSLSSSFPCLDSEGDYFYMTPEAQQTTDGSFSLSSWSSSSTLDTQSVSMAERTKVTSSAQHQNGVDYMSILCDASETTPVSSSSHCLGDHSDYLSMLCEIPEIMAAASSFDLSHQSDDPFLTIDKPPMFEVPSAANLDVQKHYPPLFFEDGAKAEGSLPSSPGDTNDSSCQPVPSEDWESKTLWETDLLPSSTSNSRLSPSSPSSQNDDNSDDDDGDRPAKKNQRWWTDQLPPCRVCAEPASGLHYGVNTCEACKVFFKRCLHRKRPLQCKGKNQTCRVRGVKRVACASCRFHWCVALGMSREGIKLGRYTLSKRNENNREMKKHAALTPHSVTPAQVDQLTDRLLKAHNKMFTDWNFSQQDTNLNSKQRKQHTELKLDTLFNLQQPPTEGNDQQINQLDAGRHVKLLRLYAQCMDLQLCGLVHFAKGIPGFRALPSEDQTKLLEAAHTELLMLEIYQKLVQHLDPPGTYFPAKCDTKAPSAEMLEEEYLTAKKLQRLNTLTRGELVLVKAICLTFPDRCEVKARDKVEEIQWTLVCALHKSLVINHSDWRHVRFPDVIDCLLRLRCLTETHRKARNDGTRLVISVLA